MSAEWAAVYITAIGGAGTAANVYMTKSIYAKILELKLWALDNFIHKDEMERIRQRAQYAESENRLRSSK